ncbi:hypothetical protein QFZ29_002323 [Agromyces albus]|nr:hypothetical protein [Agromyces albus]
MTEEEPAGQAADREDSEHDARVRAVVPEDGHDAGLDCRGRADEEEADDRREQDRRSREHDAEAALRARDAHPPEFGRGDEPGAAPDHDRRGEEDSPLGADLRRDERGHDRPDDPDDLLRRGVE